MLSFLVPLLALATPPPLPLTTLRLDETGVGHFERVGRLDHGATLPLPLGHLDDALKTLTLRTDGKAPVLRFPSRLTPGMARALANLPAEGETLDHLDLLRSLKGAPVKVRTGGKEFGGRVVDVVREVKLTWTTEDGKRVEKEHQLPVLLLLTDAAELMHITVEELQNIRPLDQAHVARMRGALDALSANNARFAMELTPSNATITAGYVTEVPVWRATWRIALDGKQARLQGFALLHNDTDEAWDKVHVELLSGRPTSFVYPLAAPRYVTRELVTPQEQLSTVPQLLGTTADALWGENAGSSGSGDVNLGGQGYGSGGGGFGSSHTTVSGKGEAPTEPPPLDESPQGSPLFTYALAVPLSLPPHQSALVPFLDAPVEATRVTLFGQGGGNARAVVRITNNTGHTFPEGPVALQESGAFSGEAVLHRLAGLQVQWLDFAEDLNVSAEVFGSPAKRVVEHVTCDDDGIRQHVSVASPVVWTITNLGGAPRTVHIPLPGTGTVTGVSREDHDGVARLGVLTVPNGVSRHTVVSSAQSVEKVAHAAVDPRLFKGLLAAGTLPPADAAILKEALAAALALEERGLALSSLKKDLEDGGRDVERVRENLKGAPTNQKLVDRVLQAEDLLAASRKRVSDEEKAVAGQRAALRAVLMRLKRPA